MLQIKICVNYTLNEITLEKTSLNLCFKINVSLFVIFVAGLTFPRHKRLQRPFRVNTATTRRPTTSTMRRNLSSSQSKNSRRSKKSRKAQKMQVTKTRTKEKRSTRTEKKWPKQRKTANTMEKKRKKKQQKSLALTATQVRSTQAGTFPPLPQCSSHSSSRTTADRTFSSTPRPPTQWFPARRSSYQTLSSGPKVRPSTRARPISTWLSRATTAVAWPAPVQWVLTTATRPTWDRPPCQPDL